MPLTEQTIAQAVNGSSSAFEEIVFEFEKKIYNLAFRYIGNEQDALDISQEVFLRIYRFLPKFVGDSKFSTWIYRIATNVCNDFSAKNKRNFALTLDGDEESQIQLPDERFCPERELDRRETAEILQKAIDSLPPDMREIVVMRDISGLTYEEIGEALELESGTVKSRIYRAREKLRIFISENGNISKSPKSNRVKGGGLL